MNNRDIVVRIIQPAEKPQPQRQIYVVTHPSKKIKLLQNILNVIALGSICAMGGLLAASFFSFGFTVNDIAVIVGIPLVLGIVTTYALF